MIDNVSKLIRELRDIRARHGFRAETLVPDLAFIGLVDDTIDAAEEALQLVNGPRPHRAYAMVRIAFEAAQRLLVLATAEDYINLGTRAWLYYIGKDEALHGGKESIATVTEYSEQIVQTWALRYSDAAMVVAIEAENLRKIRRPDNFMGRDLAQAVGDAYVILAKAWNFEVPPQVVEDTREAYHALCRDAHACIRLELRSIQIDSDGFVEVVERRRNLEEIKAGVSTGLSSSLSEALTAVSFRMSRRRNADIAAISSAAAEHAVAMREGFRPDFGLFLLGRGLAGATQVFPSVVLVNIGILPDGTLSSSMPIEVDGETYLATFDFKGGLARLLRNQIHAAFQSFALPPCGEEPSFVVLPVPYEVALTATVGYFKHNDEDRFVPLVVTKLSNGKVKL